MDDDASLCVCVCVFFFSGHSGRNLTSELTNGPVRWPKAVLSPLRWCRTVGDAIAVVFGNAISKVGQVMSLTKANMCRRSNT